MSFASRAAGPAPKRNHGLPCSVAVLLEKLDDTESAHLQAMLDNQDEWPHLALERAIRDEGHKVGTKAVQNHRRGDCRCGR